MYDLMHEDLKIAELDDDLMLTKIIIPEEMPMGSIGHDKDAPLSQINYFFNTWNVTRTIPAERPGLEKIIAKCGNIETAVQKALGVSLIDTYWFRPAHMQYLSWSDVNFHDNGFQDDFLYLLMGKNIEQLSSHLPDFTTNGMRDKAWILADARPTLIKKGPSNSYKESLLPANEVFASKILDYTGIPHVSYYQLNLEGKNVCACPCFINNPHTDFISARMIMESTQGHMKEDLWRWYNDHGMGEMISCVIIVDALLYQTDRHLLNMGIVKDKDGIRFAPLYDNEACVGWNAEQVAQGPVKPFARNINAQLELATVVPKLPSEREAGCILQETYEAFGIPQERFEIAYRSLSEGYDRVEEKIRDIERMK